MRNKPLKEISSEIANMRDDVRSKHVDIRSNAKVFMTMWAYCQRVARDLAQEDEDEEEVVMSEGEVVMSPPPTKKHKTRRTAA